MSLNIAKRVPAAVFDHVQPTTFAGMKSSARAPREEIQHRAYAIWQEEGQPADRSTENWLQAENEVMSAVTRASIARLPSR